MDFDRDKLEILKFDDSIKKKKIEENKEEKDKKDEKDSENHLDKTTKETIVKR